MIVAVSLLITLALFAYPLVSRLLTDQVPASSPAAVAPTNPATQGSLSGSAGRKYVVRPGDTLRSIAARLYGDEARWADLFRANRRAIRNPDALDVGTTLTVP
jgi:nucleoid-associated protein YgaU